MDTFDVTLGRLAFRTVQGDPVESLGDTLEAVGAALTAAERSPRGANLVLPVAGPRGVPDQAAQGERLRRQVRALLNNAQARMTGLYFAFAADPQLDGWLLVGGGDLSYDGKGPSVGKYKLELTSAYRVGSMRTHRPGRRLEAYDRRKATVATDTLGRFYGPMRTGSGIYPVHYLPVGASDVVSNRAEVLYPDPALVGRDGPIPALYLSQHGDNVDFELDPADLGKGDVVILDQQGAPGDQSAWEEVYGNDQPLTAGDVPTLDNSVARTRYDAGTRTFIVDRWSTTAGAFEEQGKLAVLVSPDNGVTVYRPAELAGVHVIEWTPERAVIRATLLTSVLDRRHRLVVLLTLQRGWLGPRIEVYPMHGPYDSQGPLRAHVRWSPVVAGGTPTVEPVSAFYSTTQATGQTMYTSLIAVQEDPVFTNPTDTHAYGAARSAIGLTVDAADITAAAQAGYISAHVMVTSGTPPLASAALVDTRHPPILVAR